MHTEPGSMNYWLWLGAALGVGFATFASAVGAIASVLKSASFSKKRGTMILLFISNFASGNALYEYEYIIKKIINNQSISPPNSHLPNHCVHLLGCPVLPISKPQRSHIGRASGIRLVQHWHVPSWSQFLFHRCRHFAGLYQHYVSLHCRSRRAPGATSPSR